MPKVVNVDERRATLIAATRAAIAREGLANVTLRSIARSAGWTTGIVTHYFTDKRDLLMATFDSIADHARERLEVMTAAGMPLLDAAIETGLPLDAERLTDWRASLAYIGAAVGDEEMAQLHSARSETFIATVCRALREEQAAGRLPMSVDTKAEGYRLVVMIQGISVQAVLNPDRCRPDVQRRLIAAHLEALGRTPPATARRGRKAGA